MRLPDFILSEPLGFHTPALASWMRRYDEIFSRIPMDVKIPVAIDAANPRALTLADFVLARRPYEVSADGVASIHVNGALSRTATGFDQMLGDTHYNQLIAEMESARTDSAVRGVMLDVASPGGSVVGAPEAAAAVAAVRAGGKPVVSYIEVIGASAAYYFAAASSKIIVSPSALVGSIGTITTLTNIAGMLARLGIQIELLTPEKSDLKATGNSVRPVTDKERAFLQGRLESMNADFTAWVQTYRQGVKEEAMRGQWFSGTESVAMGLSDATGSREEAARVLRSLIGVRPPAAPPKPSKLANQFVPEVIGNEIWRAAVTHWERAEITAEALRPCPPHGAPGIGFDEAKHRSKNAAVREVYLPARIERLRFEIKRFGGATMKPFVRKPERQRIRWEADHYEMGYYERSLASHLAAILDQYPDAKLAAQIRAANFPNR